MTVLLLLVVAASAVAGGLLTAVALIHGNGRGAVRRGAAVVIALAAYGAALIGVGVASPARQLAIGQAKCFDDWCVDLRSVTVVAGHEDTRQLAVVVSSRARRITQRPDNPVAYLRTGAQKRQVWLPGLDQRLGPGQEAELHLTLAIPAGARRPELLVTEGGWPSALVIGDENSPWHAQFGWPL